MNPEIEEKKDLNWRNSAREWAKTIVIALLIALPIRFFIAEPFIVNGASMDPTFDSGNFLIIDRLSYRFQEPQRDDVIVFKYPFNQKVYYIKRIIGLPNETIKIQDGKITIVNEENKDGFVLDESFISESRISHDTSTTKLGPNEYFVMGDNRIQSSDSRTWGLLDQNLIVGRPILQLFPFSNISIWPGQINP